MKKLFSGILALILTLSSPVFAFATETGTTGTSDSTTTTTTTETDTTNTTETYNTTSPETGTVEEDAGAVEDEGEDEDDQDEEDQDDNEHKGWERHGKGKYKEKYQGIQRALESLLKVLEDGKGHPSDRAIEAVIQKLMERLKQDRIVESDDEAEEAVEEEIETEVETGTATEQEVEILVTIKVKGNKVEEAQKSVETALEKNPASDKLYSLLSNVLKQKGDTKDIKVYVKGKKPIFDVKPYTKENRSMVPVRAIAEALGAEVSWVEETQTVVIVKDGKTIELPLGSKVIKVGGETKIIDAVAEKTNNRTFVPVRFISEFLGHTVNWDEETNTVIVK